MELMLIRHLWGVDGPWHQTFPRFKAKGYGGIESSLPGAGAEGKFAEALEREGLRFIAQVHTHGKDVDAHLGSFQYLVRRAAALKPLFVNSHSGSDGWDEADAIRFFRGAADIARAEGVAVAHELHRGRILFHPRAAARMLAEFPDLELTCDFSHWVCVCERIPDDQEPTIRACARRARHIHARVGHEHGPQVGDPRAPEFARHLEAHEKWWDWAWEAQRERGFALSTLTPEFGPVPYFPALPYTQAPVGDLEGICDWMAARQRERFGLRAAARPQA